MIDYIYDGTFDGLLTVIWHHYYTGQAARICTGDCYQPGFLCESREVVTDTEKADKVYRAIREKISEYDLRGVYRAWLSCDPEKEMKILRYVVLGFREGHRTSSLHGDPVVADFQAIQKKISRESERMLQFVRFSVVQLPGWGSAESVPAEGALPGAPPADEGSSDNGPTRKLNLMTGNVELPEAPPEGRDSIPAELSSTARPGDAPADLPLTAGPGDAPAELSSTARPGDAPADLPLTAGPGDAPAEILYARIEPDNDVIELAARHFSDRFRNERIIIHDVGRDKAVIAWHGRWIVSVFKPEDVPEATKEEREYRRLWKQYFDHIAIMERRNTRCQNNFIPDRYRKQLTEIITADE